MKVRSFIAGILCILLFPCVGHAAPIVESKAGINTECVQATLTDENGNKIEIPVEISDIKRDLNVEPVAMSDIDGTNESYYQEFSTLIDPETVQEAVTRVGGTYGDIAYDASMTLKLWGKVYFDKNASNQYLVTRMEGHFKNLQPERLDLINRNVVVACTNNFNEATAQHKTWRNVPSGFNYYTGFKYYADATRPFAAVGGSMSCQGRTSDGHTWDVFLSLPLGGSNVLPGLDEEHPKPQV